MGGFTGRLGGSIIEAWNYSANGAKKKPAYLGITRMAESVIGPWTGSGTTQTARNVSRKTVCGTRS